MRLLTFMVVAVLVALIAMILSFRAGTTVGAGVLNGVATLVVLQIAYAVYLGVTAAMARRDRKPPHD